jgi:amino acid transporter
MSKFGNKTAWLILLFITVATVAIVFTPVWLIKPFSAQTARALEVSYLLKSCSPALTIVFALAAIGLAVFIWKNARRWYRAVPLVLPLAIILVFTWFARQNHFEWMFNPLANARFAGVAETDFVADDEMVLAVKINGDAVAFPVRQMAYHHIAQDVVGGVPITATY